MALTSGSIQTSLGKQHITISGSAIQFMRSTGSNDVLGQWEIDPDDGQSIQFRIPKEKFGGNTDRVAFYVSSSGNIGIGTKDPEEAFDVRDMKEDVAETAKEQAKFGNAVAKERKKLFQASRTEANQVLSGSLKGNANTATTLQTARAIGGVSFNGSADIKLPGVNAVGNQNTTGNAATATSASYASTGSILSTARTIGGVSFDGSANINLPGVNTAGNQATTGNAATATQVMAGTDKLTFTVNKTTLTISNGKVTWTLLGKG